MSHLKNQAVLDKFRDTLPKKPYCTNDPRSGADPLLIRPKLRAITYAHIQPNSPYYLYNMVFDIDYEAAVAELLYCRLGVPMPNIITSNKHNGKAHVIYQLETPIYKTDASRPKPILYAQAIENALIQVLDADRSYRGFLTKNPLSDEWHVTVAREKPYTLSELAQDLELSSKDLNKPKESSQASGLGRNCYMFDTVRHWAYVEIRSYRSKTYNQWLNAVIDYCIGLNKEFLKPMSLNEVKGIARSISRYCWKRDPHCYQEFIYRQQRRGAKGGKKSKGGGRPSLGEPWIDMGISRRTWFRKFGTKQA